MNAPVQPPTSSPARDRAEMRRIVVSMTVACAIGALVLGAIHVATDRYATRARAAREAGAITQMLSLEPGSTVREISLFLDRAQSQVVYRLAGENGAPSRRLVFSFDGERVSRSDVPAAHEEARSLEAAGRIFVATRGGRTAGFVIEGESQGYKNVIRFFVALDSTFSIAGVRVVEHEEIGRAHV